MSDYNAGSGLVGFFLALLVIWVFTRRYRNRRRTYRLFKERLSLYAGMQFPRCADNPCSDLSWSCRKAGFCVDAFPHDPTRNILTTDQHKILLGVLKKIEAKSGIIATVLVFAFTAILTILTGEHPPKKLSGAALFFCSGVLVAAVIASIDSVAHLGQSDYERMAGATAQPIRARELQKQLIRDAIKKEDVYRANWWLCLLTIVGAVTSYLAGYMGY